MALPDSSLYLTCASLMDAISAGIQANTHGIKLYMGAPADIAAKIDEDRLNLFFYRFEPSGFQAGIHPNDPWRMRVFCLLTCMSENGDDQGLGDLRMLGLVLSYLHEQRIQPLVTVGTEQLRLQAIFSPVTDEQVNQIWSTQGDTTYRPSVIYEIALAPILPSTQRGQAPRVGFTGLETMADMNRRFDPFAGNVDAPAVKSAAVSQTNPAWTPVMCWVVGDECQASISIDVDITDPASVTPILWVAGQSGASVEFEWQLWQAEQWTSIAATGITLSSTAIEPDNIPVGLPAITLPVLDTSAAQSRWQLLLYATRNYQPVASAAAIVLRSNPLLISLYRGSTL